MLTNRIKLPRTPNRLDVIPGQAAGTEQMLVMVVGLTSEITILRARLDACERLLEQAGVLSVDAVDAFEPDEAAQAQRDAQRQRILRKIMRPLEEAATAELAAATRSTEEKRA